jgi:hypothetical protein
MDRTRYESIRNITLDSKNPNNNGGGINGE